MDLSIIIIGWNTKDLVRTCFSKIYASKDNLCKEILFVDNGSTDGTAEVVRSEFPEVTLIQSPENIGFTRGNNLAYEQACGKYVLMLNSDAFILEKTLKIPSPISFFSRVSSFRFLTLSSVVD